jgi:hypothetical protein
MPTQLRDMPLLGIAGADPDTLVSPSLMSLSVGQSEQTLARLQCPGAPISPVGMILVSGVAKISQAKAARRPEFGRYLTAENQSSLPNPLQGGDLACRAIRAAPIATLSGSRSVSGRGSHLDRRIAPPLGKTPDMRQASNRAVEA